ncbi:hypothetical protein VNO77_04539 [Canavalia gladiata]|uniref:Uncharacterized protein n=1 Tax=Canavalia gladiata TaxID=3824 RepID=A0AAN9MXC5_CANGL
MQAKAFDFSSLGVLLSFGEFAFWILIEFGLVTPTSSWPVPIRHSLKLTLLSKLALPSFELPTYSLTWVLVWFLEPVFAIANPCSNFHSLSTSRCLWKFPGHGSRLEEETDGN